MFTLSNEISETKELIEAKEACAGTLQCEGKNYVSGSNSCAECINEATKDYTGE